MTVTDKLARNQNLMLNCLRDAGRAMTAYDLLEALRDQGLRAPVQVYRALETLRQRELVHRIESLNAFVACRHLDHTETAAFAICDDCREIWKFSLPAEAGLTAVADRKRFKTRHTIVELHGRCAHCADRADG
ncbi:MAG: transcriptional repressor [Alphaproteobacteria bacterium]|nr:transcriptional repressor [Alphaproteobacteria bacterium]